MNFYFQTESIKPIKAEDIDVVDIASRLYDLESEGKIQFESKVKIFDDSSLSCFFSSSEDIMSLVIGLNACNFSLVYWSEYMYGEIKNMKKEKFQKEFDGLVFL